MTQQLCHQGQRVLHCNWEHLLYFSSSCNKSRENYLRLLRGPHEDYVLNEYAHNYLIAATTPVPSGKLNFPVPVSLKGSSLAVYLQG